MEVSYKSAHSAVEIIMMTLLFHVRKLTVLSALHGGKMLFVGVFLLTVFLLRRYTEHSSLVWASVVLMSQAIKAGM